MNLQKPNFFNLHHDIAQTPQDHISIDLLGPYMSLYETTLIPLLQFETSQVIL